MDTGLADVKVADLKPLNVVSNLLEVIERFVFEAIERAEPDMLHPWTRRGGLFRGTEWG